MSKNPIPQHIAIIMDGNGRWAKQRGQERIFGHQAGAETVHVITEAAARAGVKYLTLYTFSMENWDRPSEEVGALMNLLVNSIDEDKFMKNGIRFKAIGDLSRLPEDVQQRIESSVDVTCFNKRLTLILALSYSARWEIADTAQRIAYDIASHKLSPRDVTDKLITSMLTTCYIPDPDLLIRTGGEKRLSNFLLWQMAYTELYFCDTLWPDFNEEAFQEAINDYRSRERRFGKTSEQKTKL